jgi:hypothetical protein
MEEQETFEYYIYTLSWNIKIIGNKVWSGPTRKYVEIHEAWL